MFSIRAHDADVNIGRSEMGCSGRHDMSRIPTQLRTVEIVFLVAVGGFVGANLRHAVSLLVPGLGGTFAANVLGCFALGFLVYEAELLGVLARETSYVAGTGFLSSFTTYSTFALETVQSAPAVALAYVGASYSVGFAAVLVGRAVARRLAEGP